MSLTNHYVLRNKFIISCLLILSIVLIRWAVGGFDISYFIVAGEQFVNESEASIKVNEGPGYDGQFFYAYATSPCSAEKEISSVTIDFPAYRQQRIVYPSLVWLFSFGKAALVPFNMVLINSIALLLLVLLFTYFQKFYNQNVLLAFAPFLISGLWMSLSRNLAENIEGLFIVLSFYFLHKKKLLGFVICSALAIFSREPSIIILFPVSVIWAYHIIFNSKGSDEKVIARLTNAASLFLPFFLFFCWKIYLAQIHELDSLLIGESNIGIPFIGIYEGFKYNFLNATDLISYPELGMWIAYFVWNLFLLRISSKSLSFKLEKDFYRTSLSVSWVISLVFATTYSVSIFIDDWAFVRVLSSFNLLAFLLIASDSVRKVSNLFYKASFILVILTIIRIIVRI